MRLDDESESSNVESQRGGFSFPGRGGGGLMLGGGRMGCGTLVVVIVLALVFGINPLQLLGGGEVISPQQQLETEHGQAALGNDPTRHMVAKVLGSTERVWGTVGANVAALMGGARLFRVHDVRPNRHALDVAWAIMSKSA